MARYVLIESRDPVESTDVAYFYDFAAGLQRDGNEVTLMLVQNGVKSATQGDTSGALETLAKGGVRVLADEVSLKERGITDAPLAPGLEAADLSHVVDEMDAGVNVMWH